MSERRVKFAVLVATLVAGLFSGSAEALHVIRRSPPSKCVNANPSQAGLQWSNQGVVTNNDASSRIVVCPVEVEGAITPGHELSVVVRGGGGNGITCALYMLAYVQGDNPAAVLGSTVETTGSSPSNVTLTLENTDWGYLPMMASLKCSLGSGESLYHIYEDEER